MIDLRHLPNPIPDEKLVFLLRRHPITILMLAIVTGLLLVAPFGINWYLQTYRTDILENLNLLTPLVLIGSIFFLFAWLFLFQYFIDYYLDTWIVTTRRIISIEQSGLFNHTVSESRLYRIQDVTASTSGFWATVFNYGTVEIQTAGEKNRFMFEQISDPNHVSKTILELTEIDRRDQLDVAVEEFGMAERLKAARAKAKT